MFGAAKSATSHVQKLIVIQTDQTGPVNDVGDADSTSQLSFETINGVEEGTTVQRQITCPICGVNFNTKKNLMDHGREIHLKLLTFTPNGEVTVSERLLSKCTECEFSAVRKGRLTRHLEEKHGIIEDITCDFCGKKFPSHRALQHHFSQFHTFNDILCDICGKKCKNRSALQRHVLMHNRSFTCEHCGRIFKDRRCYTQHLKIHQARISHECPHCKQLFTQKFNMINHIKVQHLKEGRLDCELCQFSTFYKDALNDHVDRVHHGKKKVKYVCSYCAKTFSRRLVYDEHVDKHEGRYRYCCQYCGKKYRNKARCKVHSSLCEFSSQTAVGNANETLHSTLTTETVIESSDVYLTVVQT